ncbi:MAG: carbamoyltransferase HypF, partial [Gemmatimonadaceae bacterium]
RAAAVAEIRATSAEPQAFTAFSIEQSNGALSPTTGISPDLPVCDDCLAELFDPSNRRNGYPYINCSACGPRFSIIEALPYDRASTTMRDWQMCEDCRAEFEDPSDRRFHAQPIACARCGPAYVLLRETEVIAEGSEAIATAASELRSGRIVAIKGIGGYHLACNAVDATAVAALRQRKFRKEQPFAVMVRDLDVARATIQLSPEAEDLLCSPARPIVLGRALVTLDGVAPDTHELGVLLPYTPLHHLLFAANAPDKLVMTSGNRSSEPIAYRDAEAHERLSGIADVFLTGERPIARRVDDSVVRVGPAGASILRRSRGYAPLKASRIPLRQPTLAVGADLKNSVTLVVNGDAIVSQHIGDLSHLGAVESFRETIEDLLTMYRVDRDDLCIVHDLHPQYTSTIHALDLDCDRRIGVQHHRAHVASVLAEREAFDERVVGVAFDGTGFGDDGTIWGGEFFAGSIISGFERVAHLRQFTIPGGDAAAQFPVQAAAGVLAETGIDVPASMRGAPFLFPDRYSQAWKLLSGNVRCFRSTSAGRLFDTVAALLGFVRESTYEGQAAMWLENLARSGGLGVEMKMPFENDVLDFRPAVLSVIELRKRSVGVNDIARAFHRALAAGLAEAVASLCTSHSAKTVVLSGGVFQNELLLTDLLELMAPSGLQVWTNNLVPPNDGGLSLGQAAMALGHP